MEKENKKTTEIPFGAKDSELYKFEYTIPDGYEAEIKDGKVIVKKKESEGERIRKGLLEIFNKAQFGEWGKLKIKDIIAWLERQKEQKPAECSEEDKEMISSIKQWLDENEPQYVEKEQSWLDTLPERLNLQPKQEWSDEDEKRLKSIIHRIEVQFACNIFGEGKLDVDWLKSLPERFNLRPRTEWSEKDEKMR